MAQRTQIKKIIEVGVSQANINAVDLNSAVAALAQENARARVSAGSVTDLTDNSGGTGDTATGLVAVVTPTVAAVDNVVAMSPKAAFDTQIGLIEDAHEEIGVKATEIIDLIAAGAAGVGSIAAAATADDTIAAITVALTGTTADDEGVEDATGIAQIVNARNIQSMLCAAVNYVRVAQGLPPIADNSGGLYTKAATADWAPDDAAATGTAAANGENSLTDTTVDAALVALRTNIATLAAALTEANAPAIGPFVVATNNPSWKFIAGDTTL